MNHLLNLIRKELKELITPGTLVSILVISLMFAGIGMMVDDKIESSMTAPKFVVVNTDARDGTADYSNEALAEGTFDMWYHKFYGASYKDNVLVSTDADVSTPESRLAFMKEKGKDIMFVISPDYSEKIATGEMGEIRTYWVQHDSGMMNTMSVAMVSPVIGYFSNMATHKYLVDHGLSPEDAAASMKLIDSGFNATYLHGDYHEGVTPAQISSALSSQTMFVPIIVMLIVVMIGSVLIASIGSEKENKTLETLLTMPVSRTTVVLGKIFGAAITGLVFGGIYMMGMAFYLKGMSRATASSPVSLESLGLSLGAIEWGVVFLFIFLSLFCALGLCIILGAFAKNYKSAQMYVMPISILAMVPMFVNMFSSYESLPAALQVIIFAIPFSHPMMILENLMFGNTAMLIGGLAYLVGFSAVTILIAVRLYKSDILITGLIKKDKEKSLFGFSSGK